MPDEAQQPRPTLVTPVPAPPAERMLDRMNRIATDLSIACGDITELRRKLIGADAAAPIRPGPDPGPAGGPRAPAGGLLFEADKVLDVIEQRAKALVVDARQLAKSV